jgi:hypothetical protein
MRVMASEIISSCTMVCPYLIRLSIMEGSIPHPPVTPSTSTPHPTPIPNPLLKNFSQSSDPFDETIHLDPSLPSSFLSPPRYPALEYQSQSILFVIIERILCDDEAVVVEHLGDTLKVLLEPERIEDTSRERFLSLFYDYYMNWLLLPFTRSDSEPDQPVNILTALSLEDTPLLRSTSSSFFSSPSPLSSSPSLSPSPSPSSPAVQFKLQSSSAIYASRRLISEIFSLCLFSHRYRIRALITRSNLLQKFLRLLTSRSRHYHIFPLKLMKNVLTLKDDQYQRYIVKQNLFKPIFELFSSLYLKDNVITSTIIDILEFIRGERLTILILYIAEKMKDYYRCCLSSSASSSGRDADSGQSQTGAHDESESQKETDTEKRPIAPSQESCQSYYTELFETFELTYSQLKEYEDDRERGGRFQGAGESGGSPERRSKRGPPGSVGPHCSS